MPKDSQMTLFSRPLHPLSDERRQALAEDERALAAARAVLLEYELPDHVDMLEAIILDMEQADEPETVNPSERISVRRGNVIEVAFGADAFV